MPAARAQAGRQAVETKAMDADLFSPADTAALLAIRAFIADRMPSAIELRALFDASGLIRAPGAGRRAAMPSALPARDDPRSPAAGRLPR